MRTRPADARVVEATLRDECRSGCDGPSRVIDEIRDLNPTADAAFLSEFAADELETYLRRLRMAVEAPKSLPWVRRNDVWPVAMRDCA